MKMEPYRWLFAIALMLFLLPGGTAFAGNGGFVGFYGGRATDSNIGEILLLEGEVVDSYMTTLFVGKELGNYRSIIDTELEGQVVKHFGDQDHWEFNGSFNLRWQSFFWDRFVDTSLAVGIGLSYATEEPIVERQKNDETSRLLAYLMIELDFVLPRQENWSIFTRLHHRSGAWGLFDGVHGGSNILGAGLKYSFD